MSSSKLALKSLFVFCLLGLLVSVATANEQQTELIQAIQKHPEKFEAVTFDGDALLVDFDVALGENSLVMADENVFDGLRFTVPESSEDRDFVWYFNVSDAWAQWYICPVNAPFQTGFRNWLFAD